MSHPAMHHSHSGQFGSPPGPHGMDGRGPGSSGLPLSPNGAMAGTYGSSGANLNLLAQAQAAGIAVDAPAVELSGEQAAALVAEQIAAHVRQVAPPPAEQLQAQAARNITTMRGPATDDPFGIDEPKPPTAEDAPDDPGVPGVAQLEQQAAQIKARILGLAQNGGDWTHTPCNENKRKAVNRDFAILIPNEDRRHAIRQYILGHDSSSYTEGEVATLLGWFDIQKGPDGWVPGVQALAEIKVLAAALGLDKADEVSA